MSPPRYRLAIFDFDGTLADSAGWIRDRLPELAAAHHFHSPTPEELEALRGVEPREVLRRLGIPGWKLPLLARDVRARMAKDAASIRLFPGVPALLEAIDTRGVRIALVTSNAEVNARAILGADLAARIDRYACGASLFGKRKKLRDVLRALDVSPSETVAVGDEVRDLDAARAEGIATVAVTWGYASRPILAARGPTFLVDRVEAILDCFG